MTTRLRLIGALLLVVGAASCQVATPPASVTTAPTSKPVTAPAPATAASLRVGPGLPKVPVTTTIPATRPGDWMKRHDQYVALAKAGNIDLYFEGDSITDGWHGAKKIWDKEFGPWKPANFGIGGDKTEHVLWRLQNGEFENVKPKVVVLMIGTNNGGGTVENIAAGVTADVREIQKQSPSTKILLLAIFPRSEKATDPIRDKLKKVNAIIAKLDDGKTVKYLDIGDKFLDADGTLSTDIMPDFLHPNAKGYQIWADAIKLQLKEWLGEPAASTPAK